MTSYFGKSARGMLIAQALIAASAPIMDSRPQAMPWQQQPIYLGRRAEKKARAQFKAKAKQQRKAARR